MIFSWLSVGSEREVKEKEKEKESGDGQILLESEWRGNAWTLSSVVIVQTIFCTKPN